MNAASLATFRDAAAVLPWSEHALRHLYRMKDENGLAAAFVRVGGRVFVDLERLGELLDERREVEPTSASVGA